MKTRRRLGSPGAAAAYGAACDQVVLLAAGHARWWAILAVIAPLTLPACLRAVLPQDSKDKLAWWRGYWARHGAPAAARARAGRGAPPIASQTSVAPREPSSPRPRGRG